MPRSAFSREKILIVTSGALCRNPRPLKEAWTLGEAGYDVTVATVANVALFEASDRELLRDAPFRKVAVNQIAPGLKRRSRGFIERTFTWAARRAARFGWNSPHAFGPYSALLRVARKCPAALTIGHTELGLCVAYTLSKEGRKVAADFEDWHSRDLLPQEQAARPLALLVHVEHELLRHAVYSSTTSHALAAALQADSGGARPVVITNSFPLIHRPPRPESSGRPALVWFSQTIGPGRGLVSFLKAWSRCESPSRLSLLGNVSPHFRAELMQMVPSSRQRDVEFIPFVAPQDLPSIIAAHDVGLALERSTPPSRNLTITNKILQYLNAGVAIVASETEGQREVMSRAANAGIVVDLAEPASVAVRLDAMLSDREKLAAMGAAARSAAEATYCWERESPRLIEAVEGVLAR